MVGEEGRASWSGMPPLLHIGRHWAPPLTRPLCPSPLARPLCPYMYSGNLKDFKVVMPHNYIGGGSGDSGKLTSNLDVITGFSALGLMEKSGGAKTGGLLSK